MPKVQFLGRTLPATAVVNTTDLPKTNWKMPDLDLHMTFTVQIVNSIMSVDIEINKWDKDEHLVQVYMRALDIARGAVDLCSFRDAVGLTVVFETLVEPDETTSLLSLQQPELAGLASSVENKTPPATSDQNNFDKVLRHILTNPALIRALHDLTEVLSQTHISPIACGRAMEGIRHFIAPGLERKKGWAKMNKALRIDRAYLEVITDTSAGPRHADPAHVSGCLHRHMQTRVSNCGQVFRIPKTWWSATSRIRIPDASLKPSLNHGRPHALWAGKLYSSLAH
jgi:hypothetical protein